LFKHHKAKMETSDALPTQESQVQSSQTLPEETAAEETAPQTSGETSGAGDLEPGPTPLPDAAPVVEEEPTISIEELMLSYEGILGGELHDRTVILSLLNMNTADLRTRLLSWASISFPHVHILFSFSLAPPPVCSDGVTRAPYDYLVFLLGCPLADKLRALEAKMSGISLSYSMDSSNNRMNVHVSKKEAA